MLTAPKANVLVRIYKSISISLLEQGKAIKKGVNLVTLINNALN